MWPCKNQPPPLHLARRRKPRKALFQNSRKPRGPERFGDGLLAPCPKGFLDNTGKHRDGSTDGSTVGPRACQGGKASPGNGRLFPKVRAENIIDPNRRMMGHPSLPNAQITLPAKPGSSCAGIISTLSASLNSLQSLGLAAHVGIYKNFRVLKECDETKGPNGFNSLF